MKVRLSWFSVNDFESAKKFYGNVLGLKKTFEAPEWAEFAGAEGEESIGVAVHPHAGKEPGATIVLRAGSYHESVVIPSGKRLTASARLPPTAAMWLSLISAISYSPSECPVFHTCAAAACSSFEML